MKKSCLPLLILGLGAVLTAGKDPVQRTAGNGQAPPPLGAGPVFPAPSDWARPAVLPPVRHDAFSAAPGAGDPADPAAAQALTPLSAAQTPSRRPHAAHTSELRPAGSPGGHLEDLDLGGHLEYKGAGPAAGPGQAWGGAGAKVLITVPQPGAGATHRLGEGSTPFQEAFTVTNATGDFLIFHLVRPEPGAEAPEPVTRLLPAGRSRSPIALSHGTRRNFLLRDGKAFTVCLQDASCPARYEILDAKAEPVHAVEVRPGLDPARPFQVFVDQMEAGAGALAFLRGLGPASASNNAGEDAKQGGASGL